jgi:hypothetical protein
MATTTSFKRRRTQAAKAARVGFPPPTEVRGLPAFPLIWRESDVFTTMTIRELRNYIRDNQLHDRINNHLGKSVSKACKHELIAALQ